MDNEHFQTRPDICQYMASLLPPQCEHVLEPTPGQGNLVQALKDQKKHVVTPHTDFWKDIDERAWFDAVVMNPPFTPMKEGYEILDRCMELTHLIVALMPWLTIINSVKRTKKITDFGLLSVTHLPRTAFPGSRVQTCILKMVYGYTGTTNLYFYEENDEQNNNL